MSCCVSKLDLCRLIQESFKSPTFDFGSADISNDTFVYKVKVAGGNFTSYTCSVLSNNIVVIDEYTLPVGNYVHEMLWTSENGTEVVFQGALRITSVGGCCGSNRNNTIKVIQDETVVRINVSENNIIIGGGGSSDWGGITGNIENQTDLIDFIDDKIGNGTITITQGGVSKGTFTTNQSGNTTIEVDASSGDLSNYYDKQEIDEQSQLTTAFREEDVTSMSPTWINGYFIVQNPGGAPVDSLLVNANYQYFNHIDISMYNELLISGFFGSSNGVTLYNSSYQMIGVYNATTFNGPVDSQFLNEVIALPSNAKYVRMSSKIGATNTISGVNINEIVNTEVVNHQQLYDLIQNNTVQQETKEVLYLERPKFAEIYFEGNLPTDTTPTRLPTSLTWEMKVNNKVVASAKCELSIQGHGSVQYPKKGYTFDVFNANNDGLKLKFGDMIGADSFHLKAYATDTTHARDVANGKLWRDMIETLDYPYNKVNNKPYSISATADKNAKWCYDAVYYTNGFPIAMYVNGVFHGLYTLRLKKTRENYALDRSNLNHIFLDSGTYTAYLKEAFNPTDWEIKSPRMTGYNDLGPIPVAYPTVQTACNNLFNFTRQLSTTYPNHASVINLPHWITWIIFSELISNRDTDGNNYNIITWDGVHWSIIPYDLDLTIGLDAWNNYTIQQKRDSQDINFDIWTTFKSVYNTEIKEMYTKLRESGFLTSQNIYHYYKDQVDSIPQWVYEDNRSKWGLIWTNGEPNLEQIYYFRDY